MKLSILICSLESRTKELFSLVSSLCKQLDQIPEYDSKGILPVSIETYTFSDIEIVIATDKKQLKVGAKRNLLVNEAKGDYIAFIDDDDRITPDYIELLLRGVDSGCDVINFHVFYNPKVGKSKIVLYNLNYTDSELPHCYYRASNHLMCIKREVALKVPFENIQKGEDSKFARRLKTVAKTQANIQKVLYYYDFDAEKTETQRQVKRIK